MNQNNSHENTNNLSFTKEKLWSETGFHRPIAGFWFKLVVNIIEMLISILVYSTLFNILFPFPESIGYKTVALGMFTFMFVVFDLGTTATIDRFVAEARIKNPKRMVNYIQYFIWYQMMTGLIQTTSISLYALFIVPRTELAYGVWLMLIISTMQYPGFLGVFKGTLSTLQQHNKVIIVTFIQGELVQRLTEYGFVLIGAYYGRINPAIGEIMGIAIGSVFGKYLDDFIAMAFSAKYFSKVMKSEGISAWDCFRPDFGWPLAKECLIFGIKTGASGIISVGVNLIILWEWVSYVPQYTTYIVLFTLAGTITDYINKAGEIRLTPLISESYLNDKKNLTQHYISQGLRFYALNQGLFILLIGSLSFVLPEAFVSVGLYNYLLTVPFLFPQLIRKAFQPYINLGNSIIVGANRPDISFKLGLFEQIGILVFVSIWIVWLQIPVVWGLTGMIVVMVFGDFIPILIRSIFSYIYINNQIVKLKILWWQTFGSTLIAASVSFALNMVIIFGLFPLLLETLNFIPAAAICFPFIIISILWVYYPLTALFGGWDDISLEDLKKAVEMSGPSKFLVKSIYKSITVTHKRRIFREFTDKFSSDPTLALEEIDEIQDQINKHNQ